jgi:hypothetical protein
MIFVSVVALVMLAIFKDAENENASARNVAQTIIFLVLITG